MIASNLKREDHIKDLNEKEFEMFFNENEKYIILCLQKNIEVKILAEFKRYLENKYKLEFLKFLKENNIEKILIPSNEEIKEVKKETPILDEFAKFSNIPLKKKKQLDTTLLDYLKGKNNNYLENFQTQAYYNPQTQYYAQKPEYYPNQEPIQKNTYPPQYENYQQPQVPVNPYYSQHSQPSYPPQQSYNQYMYPPQVPANPSYNVPPYSNNYNRIPQQQSYLNNREDYDKKAFRRRKDSSSDSREDYVGAKKKIRKDYGDRGEKKRGYRGEEKRYNDGYRDRERRYERRSDKRDDYARD